MAVNDVNIRLRAKDETANAFKSVKGSLGGLKNAVFSVQGAIAGIVGGAVVGTIVNANKSFQSLQASLITFTGSAEAAAAQFEVLQKFAATTPFALEEVVGGFNKLIARGINPSIESLTAFGNIASGTGKSLDQFIEAVADAAVGEFERLKEFGIKAASEGDKVSLTFGGVTKTIGKNSQEMLAYLEQLGQTKFAGSIERQANTIGGAFSNFGDSISTLSVAIGEAGLNDFLVQTTREMSRLINVTTQATKANLGLIDVIGITLREAFSDATESLKVYRKELETLKKGRSILEFLGLDLTNSNQEIEDVRKKINILLESERNAAGISGFTPRRAITAPVKALPTATVSKDQQKAIDNYNKSIIDAEVHWAGAMTGSERNARNRLKVIEDTKKALDDLKVAQTGGFYDPAQRGKRQNTLPAELEIIKETLEASKSPLQQYAESVDNVQASLQNVALSGLKSMEDALVSLVNGTMSAKDAFRSMASSIINDLIRIMIQKSITGPIAGAMDGFFSGGGKAIGGSVQSGKPYMVGERGAEMFVPNQSGSIIPSNRLSSGGGGTTIVQNINVTTGVQQTVRAEIMTLMPQIASAAKSAVADAKLRGGSYAAALG